MDKNNTYIQDKRGMVYKVMPNYFLQLSPWKNGEDRRIKYIENNDYDIISYKNACMVINKQFNSTVEEWDKKGKHYIANSIAENNNELVHSHIIKSLPNHNVVLNDVNNIMNITDNVSMSFNNGLQELKLVRHKGKMYYIMIINEYLPRVKAYNLFGEFAQWCGIGDCKPVFCETDNRYI